jgi:hypothetical protein
VSHRESESVMSIQHDNTSTGKIEFGPTVTRTETGLNFPREYIKISTERLAPQSRIEVEQLVIGGLNALSDEVRKLNDRVMTELERLPDMHAQMSESAAALAEQVGRIEDAIICGDTSLTKEFVRLAEQVGKLGERVANDSITLNVICEHQLKIEERFKAALSQVERKLDVLGNWHGGAPKPSKSKRKEKRKR